MTNSGDATVQRFNPETFNEGPLRTYNVGSRPSGIAYAGGAIWVANAGDEIVTRIDPGSGATLPITVGEGPSAIAGGSNAVWVANTAARTISRIDPNTNELVATIEIGNAPSGVAVGNGVVWVTARAP